MRRLLDRPPGGRSVEDRAAALLRASLLTAEPDARDLARIEVALRARVSRRRPSATLLRLGLAFICLVAGAATGKAYETARRAGWLAPLLPPPAPVRAPEPVRAKRRAGNKAAPVMAAPMNPSPSALVAAQSTAAPVVDDAAPGAAGTTPSPAAPAPAAARGLGRGALIGEAAPGGLGARPHRAARLAVVQRRPETALPTPARPADTRPSSLPAATALALGRPAEVGVPPTPAAVPPGPAPGQAAPPPSAASPPAPTASATALEEARGLDRAITYLRRDHDAAAALDALDAYLERYPHAVLRREASLARIDALLMLHRNEQALHALEAVTLDQGRRATELLVVRAELRAQHDCPRAEQDFTAALARSPDAFLLERILHGRGACRARLDETAGATDDVRRYLERFPDGLHADWARRWLSSRPR